MFVLEALSAGLPILVSGNSDFGDAMRSVPSGKSSVVDSEDPKVWAETIAVVRNKKRPECLKFDQCDLLVDKMWDKVDGAGMLMIFLFLSVDLSFVVVSQIYPVIDVNTSCISK